jgi:glycine/D-amino acid oxidase-like deaminating enzyme
MAVRVDVAVIGAGAFGLSVALHCSGFSFSPAIGEALADWITAGHRTSRLGPFAPSRFGSIADEQLVSKGAWEYAHFYGSADA